MMKKRYKYKAFAIQQGKAPPLLSSISKNSYGAAQKVVFHPERWRRYQGAGFKIVKVIVIMEVTGFGREQNAGWY
jgi:hypothetical protein